MNYRIIFLLLFVSGNLLCQTQKSLTKNEKIYGLSKIWSETKTNYVNYDKLTFDWDSLYISYLKEIQNTSSDVEYYLLLKKFFASLKDGHSTVTLPKTMKNIHRKNFPIRFELIEKKVMITDIYNDSLQKIGFKKGYELLKIDGIDIHEYVKKNVSPYISASTDQDLKFRSYTYELLRGHRESLIHLTLKSPSGKIVDYKFSRKLKWNLFKSKSNIDFKITKDKVGILTLNSFSYNDFYQKFDSIYPIILKNTKALIIDARYNGGGSSTQGYHIISHLVNKPFYGTFWVSKQYIPKMKAGSKESNYFFQKRKLFHPVKKEKYKNPTVLLIGNATFSAAEDFSIIYKNLSLGKVIGEPTGGSSGEPISFSLPGGGKFKVCTERNSSPDGTEFVGIGVQPDILVHQSLTDYKKDISSALKKALELIRSNSK